jgi:L-fuculose-phosphate aldolase
MNMDEKEGRSTVVMAARELDRLGLNHGSAGNVSLRLGDALLITPSGVSVGGLSAEMIARMPLAGADGEYEGPLPPSSEWRFHRDILRARPATHAIAHTHSPFATTLAALRRDIPAVHYMIAAFGGPTVRCVDYAPYGTAALSALAVEGLRDREAVLLANHGAIAVGADMRRAVWRAAELEALARIYWQATLIGAPVILPDDEIMRTVERFRGYGPGDTEAAPAKSG